MGSSSEATLLPVKSVNWDGAIAMVELVAEQDQSTFGVLITKEKTQQGPTGLERLQFRSRYQRNRAIAQPPEDFRYLRCLTVC